MPLKPKTKTNTINKVMVNAIENKIYTFVRCVLISLKLVEPVQDFISSVVITDQNKLLFPGPDVVQ